MPPLHQVLVSRLVGGAAVVAIHLAGAARRRGWSCSAWVPGAGPASEALDQIPVQWRPYDFDGLRGSSARQLAACARMLPGLLGRQRPLVHVQNPTVFGMMRPALVVARARTIVHFHIEPAQEEIAWTLARPPSHIVTCAKYIAGQVRAAADARGLQVPVTAVPNAIDLDRFVPGDAQAARARLGMPTSRFVALMLANLAPHKGQATALRALHRLKSDGVAIEGWFVGEDRTPGKAYERELRRLSAELGLDDVVRFLGFRNDGPELLQAADAFLLPSTHEGLPLSVLEAQATRVPVIGSAIPGIVEIVEDGHTGFIVPADDPAGYADRLKRLIDDPSRRRAITDAAALQVRRDHHYSRMEERMFAIYESVAAAR